VAVASAGPYTNLHLASDRQPHQHPQQHAVLIYTKLIPAVSIMLTLPMPYGGKMCLHFDSMLKKKQITTVLVVAVHNAMD